MAPVTLPPGFRFHPTDEELVAYYLDRKITGRPIELDIIPDVDLYKCEPWDLPDKSYLPSKDLEWYFFSRRDRKYPNGSRTNRATTAGYWKATGKDRLVKSQKRTLGMKKTLVYYRGRAPQGIRTNWVMHEYRLLESESLLKDAYALCRIFKKISCRPKAEKKHEDDLQSAPDGYLPGNEGEDLRLPPSESGSSDVSWGSPTDHNGLIYNQYCQKWSATDEGDSSTNASPMRVEQITYPNLVESVPLSDCRKWQQHYEQPHQPLAMENFPQMETTETILHIPQMFEELLVTDKYMDHLTEENLLEEIFNVASAFNDETSDLHLQNTSYLNYSTALNESNSH